MEREYAVKLKENSQFIILHLIANIKYSLDKVHDVNEVKYLILRK